MRILVMGPGDKVTVYEPARAWISGCDSVSCFSPSGSGTDIKNIYACIRGDGMHCTLQEAMVELAKSGYIQFIVK